MRRQTHVAPVDLISLFPMIIQIEMKREGFSFYSKREITRQ